MLKLLLSRNNSGKSFILFFDNRRNFILQIVYYLTRLISRIITTLARVYIFPNNISTKSRLNSPLNNNEHRARRRFYFIGQELLITPASRKNKKKSRINDCEIFLLRIYIWQTFPPTRLGTSKEVRKRKIAFGEFSFIFLFFPRIVETKISREDSRSSRL